MKNAKGRRPDYFKVNIDAAKAFDSIDRSKLIEIMHAKNTNARLVNAIG